MMKPTLLPPVFLNSVSIIPPLFVIKILSYFEKRGKRKKVLPKHLGNKAKYLNKTQQNTSTEKGDNP
jgi:hypothetical protein